MEREEAGPFLWGLLLGALLCNAMWFSLWTAPPHGEPPTCSRESPDAGCTRWTTAHARQWADEVDAWRVPLLVDTCLEMEPITVTVVMP